MLRKVVEPILQIVECGSLGLDMLEQKTFPDSSYQTWKYDANGNIVSQRTTAGHTITGSYDACNELTSEDYGSTISSAYDVFGRLQTVTEGGTALTYTYDNLGRVRSFTDQAGRQSTYGYDLDGNQTCATYPTGVKVKLAYDASNRLWKVLDGGNTAQLTVVSYDLANRPSQFSLANGTSITPTYDLINRLTSVDNALNGSARNYGYSYDNAGRCTSVTEPRGTVTYGSYSDRNGKRGQASLTIQNETKNMPVPFSPLGELERRQLTLALKLSLHPPPGIQTRPRC